MIAPAARNLLTLCCLIAGAIALTWSTGEKRWTPPEARQLDDSLFVVPVPLAPRLELAALGEIGERPLFSPTRRPPPPPTAAEAEPEPDPFRDVTVLGLFGSGSQGGALVMIDGRLKRIRYGERTGPWTLVKVEGRSAQFRRMDGSSRTLSMRYLPQPAAPAANAPPALQGSLSPQDQAKNERSSEQLNSSQPPAPGGSGAGSEGSMAAAPRGTGAAAPATRSRYPRGGTPSQ